MKKKDDEAKKHKAFKAQLWQRAYEMGVIRKEDLEDGKDKDSV